MLINDFNRESIDKCDGTVMHLIIFIIIRYECLYTLIRQTALYELNRL
jgi:hypothetical protein